MNEKGKSLIKNVGILTVSNFASKVLVFFLVPLYTSVLSTSEYGTYDLVVTTVSLLFPIFTLNIVDALMRFLLDDNYDKNKVASIGLLFSVIGIALGAALLLILYIFKLYQGIQGLEPFIFLYYVFYILNQYMIQFAKGLDRVIDMGVAGIMGTLVMIGTNVFFLLVIKSGMKGFFIANIFSQALPSIYLIIRLRLWKYINIKIEKRLSKEMLSYSIPLIASAVGWWINSGSDRYVVSIFCGLSANGVLAVAYKIPTILNTFQGIFIQAWQISAIKEYNKEEAAKFYGRVFSIINALMCAICSGLILLTKPLASVLFAKHFYEAYAYVPFLLISSVLNSASGLLGPILGAIKDSKSMAKAAIYGAIINLVLNILLVLFIGVQGVTIATVCASFVIYFVRKLAVGNHIVIEKYWTVTVTWVLLIVQACLEIYTNLVVLQIVIMSTMVLINRELLIKVLIIKKGENNG